MSDASFDFTHYDYQFIDHNQEQIIKPVPKDSLGKEDVKVANLQQYIRSHPTQTAKATKKLLHYASAYKKHLEASSLTQVAKQVQKIEEQMQQVLLHKNALALVRKELPLAKGQVVDENLKQGLMLCLKNDPDFSLLQELLDNPLSKQAARTIIAAIQALPISEPAPEHIRTLQAIATKTDILHKSAKNF